MIKYPSSYRLETPSSSYNRYTLLFPGKTLISNPLGGLVLLMFPSKIDNGIIEPLLAKTG